MRIVFEMMADLGDAGVFEDRPQRGEHLRAIELLGRARIVVLQRHVGGEPGSTAKDTPTISARM